MGFFGGDDNPNQETNDLINQQIQQNQAELEAKRANLYSSKLDIIKGQGGENWRADRTSGVSPTAGGGGRGGWPFPFPSGGGRWFNGMR